MRQVLPKDVSPEQYAAFSAWWDSKYKLEEDLTDKMVESVITFVGSIIDLIRMERLLGGDYKPDRAEILSYAIGEISYRIDRYIEEEEASDEATLPAYARKPVMLEPANAATPRLGR